HSNQVAKLVVTAVLCVRSRPDVGGIWIWLCTKWRLIERGLFDAWKSGHIELLANRAWILDRSARLDPPVVSRVVPEIVRIAVRQRQSDGIPRDEIRFLVVYPGAKAN